MKSLCAQEAIVRLTGRRPSKIAVLAIVTCLALVASIVAAPAAGATGDRGHGGGGHGNSAEKVLMFAADGMLTGGDGYAIFGQGTDVQQPGDALLDVTIGYVAANSPVAPVVEGRIVKG